MKIYESFFSITSKKRIENAIKSLKLGNGVIVLDDANRENEGDLVFPAETMTIKQMALTIRYGSGIVCLCITESKRKQLKLPFMVKNNTSKFRTNFTVTIEAAKGISTGVSAKDRITTIRTAIRENAKPQDLHRPGHIFPLQAHKHGIFGRPGHTEASIELVTLAGFKPAGILCELTNKDGSMSKLSEIIRFSKFHNIPMLTIKDLKEYITIKKAHAK
ncbi:3,4-dihydroxy-2-butanone 4-phosphate synthase [Buchnera aphidicola (Schlechtendalia chinensis)]|uniref:3,4-dihydroxy-2-butanone 4-phosphate synthase n=1 Tax=Buchnera aphidicola subsp. Schlechtendalia chinensis TaxID=118110 RepID=A0A172WD35_BUCSC|nr:3,4-dihydroxy-2-butanone-4-phosphate synthase [Buchnera aphidicola]ANF16874.1 3,4-dihydroxy-2-butanone 4-phosphate synthase [Buchnera aphidicola (Schlechtendalia chinensis)]